MYGYDVPNYVREYAREWRRYDRFLRVRRSLDHPGQYLVERKTRYVEKFPCKAGTDRQIQYKDEYRQIYCFWPMDIKYVMPSLRASDIQNLGGAKILARDMEARDDWAKELKNRKDHDDFEMASSAAYDRMAWLEGRRVSMAGRYND